MITDAEYKGKEVDLNKPKSGDVKKYMVFVKNPSTGNVKKVNFGDKNMEIKRDNPERKKSFRAKHNCDTAKDKTTPRYWSCKFWSDKSVTDILSEVVEPDSIDVNTVKKKDTLCPEVWDDMLLKNDVRSTLLKIAIEFLKMSKLDTFKYKDIILTGSLANYNWTENSDIDLHILMDFNQISDDKELVGDYLKNKKSIWNDKYPIKVKGHDVELYVQDINEPHASTGVYSLIKNDWTTKPVKEIIQLDVANIQLKASDIMNKIDDILELKNSVNKIDKITQVIDKLKLMRQTGLDGDGEFSDENIVFKILRNYGYIKKLYDCKDELLTKSLTLEGSGRFTDPNKLKAIIDKAKRRGALTVGMIVAIIALNQTDGNTLVRMGVPQDVINKATETIKSTYNELIQTVTPQQNNVNNQTSNTNDKEKVYNQ